MGEVVTQKFKQDRRRASRYLSEQGYQTRRCKSCGAVEFKSAHKWKCANPKCNQQQIKK